MKTKLLSLLVALVATTALWASNVITYTATAKLSETTDDYSFGLHTNAFNVAITSHDFSNGTGTITFADEVTTIGYQAFYNCSGLTSVTIPNSVTTIGDYAFAYCSGLTSITIPDSVTTIGDLAFYLVNNIVYNGTATGSPWGAKCVNGYVDGYLVYSDASKTTLCGCSSAAKGEITIPNSVTTIGESAFYECSGLTSITIPNSVTTIGYQAFYNCSGLTSVTIPNSVTTIGDRAFAYCSGLTSVTIPNSVTTIGERAFYECSGLTSITIPNSVTTIGDWVFAWCEGLTSVTIPNSVTTIGKATFYDCSGLTSITIPNSVTTIGDWAFDLVNNIVYNGTATGSPWGAKCVNGYVDGYLVYSDASKTTLCGCSSAAKGEITIPNSVTTIGESAFDECSGLTSITIPNSVTTIGESAFDECSGLTSITIPNSVTTIGEYAFYKCSHLSYIDFGCGLKEIGDYAFAGCNIDTAVIYSTTPPACTPNNGWGGGTFGGLSRYAYLLVPQDCERAYKLADGWEDFDIHVMEANVVPSVVDVTVTPSDNAVQVTWPISDNAVNYAIVITKGGEEIYTLNFNAQGQLVNIAFAAPGRDGSRQAPAATLTAQGYQFTVTGLTPSTAYNYSVVATDAGGKTIAEHKGNFNTTGGTGLNTLPYEGKDGKGSKYFHNGQLIIDRNGQHYSAMGERIR